MTTVIKIFSFLMITSCSIVPVLTNNIKQKIVSESSLNDKLKDDTIIVNKGFLNSHIYKQNDENLNNFYKNLSNLKFCGIKLCFYSDDRFQYILNMNYDVKVENIVNNSEYFIKTYLEYKKPDSGYLSYTSRFKLISNNTKLEGQSRSFYLIEETFEVPKIKWSGKNLYYIDKNNYKLIMSKQHISPMHNIYEIIME